MRLPSLSSLLKSFIRLTVWRCIAVQVLSLVKLSHTCSHSATIELICVFIRLVQQTVHQLHSETTHILLYASNVFSHNANGGALLGVFLDRQAGSTSPCLTWYATPVLIQAFILNSGQSMCLNVYLIQASLQC